MKTSAMARGALEQLQFFQRRHRRPHWKRIIFLLSRMILSVRFWRRFLTFILGGELIQRQSPDHRPKSRIEWEAARWSHIPMDNWSRRNV